MVGIILQARVSSSRLPGKVLKEVCNLPLIVHIFKRLERCKNVDKLILATSKETSDDPLEKLAKKYSINCFRGELNDVLDRYYQTATFYKLDIIVRLTGDCPLMEPTLIDKTIHAFKSNNFDLFSVGPKFPDGLDCQVFSYEALKDAWINAKLKSEREHVCPYIENNKKFKIGGQNAYPEYSKLRLTVDEEKDFELIKIIYEHLYPKNQSFCIEDVFNFLNANPKLARINSNILRNEGYMQSLKDDKIGV